MKRFLICALSVLVMAGAASAQDATVWIQPVGGGNHIVLGNGVVSGVSQTAIVQVWMTVAAIPYGGAIENIQVVLNADDQAGALTAGTVGANLSHIHAMGFNDQGPYGLAGTFTRQADPARGFIANPPGMAAFEGYQIIYADLITPWTASSGVKAGTYLLDEIVIHGQDTTTANPLGDTTTADTILNPGGVQSPTGYKIYSVYSGTKYYGASIAMGTGETPAKGATSPLFVSVVTPEPASLSLLVLGGLAALRRRR